MAVTGVERDPYLRPSDAFSWYIERDLLLRSTVVTIVTGGRRVAAPRS